MLEIVDEVSFSHDEKTKEKFLLVLGALSARLISLRKAAEIMELEEATLLEMIEMPGFEFSYLEEKAAEIAGLTRAEFIFSLGKFSVSPFQYTIEEIKEEISHH